MLHLLEPTAKIWMNIDPHYQQQKRRPMYLVSGGMSFCGYSRRFPEEGASNDSRHILSAVKIFDRDSSFCQYIFFWFLMLFVFLPVVGPFWSHATDLQSFRLVFESCRYRIASYVLRNEANTTLCYRITSTHKFSTVHSSRTKAQRHSYVYSTLCITVFRAPVACHLMSHQKNCA